MLTLPLTCCGDPQEAFEAELCSRQNDVPLKAGHADAHILGVTCVLQQRGQDADDSPGQDAPPARGKETGQYGVTVKLARV